MSSTVAETIDLSKVSSKDLKKLLADKEKAEKAAYEKARKGYEADRDAKVESLMKEAKRLAHEMHLFKEACHTIMDAQANILNEYGSIRSNSKGGFSITHSNDEQRIVRRRDTEPTWDERAQKGIDLINDFLHTALKKRDKDMFEMLVDLMQRNKKGDLEYSKVFILMKHRNKFNDDRWTEGLRLLEESFTTHLKGFGYEFKTKTTDGKWDSLLLNFSSI